ncbi:MAG TPA: PfkB family carbohydrate kinase [Acidobacteriaceae bacterium]|nr:PfkB family carbohydrate kinase [Acidobacteriaceae bacterium]
MSKGIFVGLATIDLVYEVDEFPVSDSKITARSQSVIVGGPATNAAITFRHLGGEPTLITGLGRHPLADLIREDLDRYKIRLIDLNPDSSEVPVLSAVAINVAGQRNVISANALGIRLPPVEVDAGELASASILMVDGHFMPACQAWAGAAKQLGIRVVLDGGSWKDGMDALLGSVDTAVCSADFRVPEQTGPGLVVEFLRSRGIGEVAVTAGSQPIRWATEYESGITPVPEVPVVDTMGAGDILHGAFCWFAVRNFTFPQALERAAAFASESCRFRGTREWMIRPGPAPGQSTPHL